LISNTFIQYGILIANNATVYVFLNGIDSPYHQFENS